MGSSVVTTRPFEAPDLRALYAIEEACFEPAVRFSRALMRSLAQGGNNCTWLGLVDEVRVGFAILGLRSEDENAALETAYIWTIEVLPAFRRLGVGRKLLHRLEESARASNCTRVELHVSEHNRAALSMYEAAGFAHQGVEAGYYGRGEDAFRYRKMLG